MSIELPAADVDDVFQQRFGDGLRGVMSYRKDGGVEVHHLRDDLREGLDDGLRDDRAQELLMDMHVAEIQERTFSLGDYSGSARFFEQATVLNFVSHGDVGMVVSLEPDTELVDRDLLDWCRGQVAADG